MFKKNTNKVRVMALGGLNEIGKNMTKTLKVLSQLS